MKLFYMKIQLLFVFYAFACKTNQIPFKRTECETNKQDKNKFGCTESSNYCRACCFYDLVEMNERKSFDPFYLKEFFSNAASNDCICTFCYKK